MRIKMEVELKEEVLKQQMKRRNLRMDAHNKKHFLSMVKSRTLTLSDAFWESLPQEEELLKAMGFGMVGEKEEIICVEAAKQRVADDVHLSKQEIESLKKNMERNPTAGWCENSATTKEVPARSISRITGRS